MEEDHNAVNTNVRGKGRVTITEAATLLGVHPNTVRGRIKVGTYDAEKVATEHGLTWMIDPDSLVNAPLPRDSQQPPSQIVNPDAVTPMEMVQDLLRPFVEDLGRVREDLGAERVRREQAERERDELRASLEALQAPEAAAGRSEGAASPRSGTIGAQTGTEGPEEPPDATESVPEASESARVPVEHGRGSGGRTGARGGRRDREAAVVGEVVRRIGGRRMDKNPDHDREEVPGHLVLCAPGIASCFGLGPMFRRGRR